jgi:glycosyltransferase involved in cell wall biosynthesis
MKPSFSFLLICQTYFPVLGGSEIEAQRVCAALIRRGHRVTVVCAGGDPMPPVQHWTDPEGVPVRIYAQRHEGPLKNIIYALRVAQTLLRERNNYQFVYFLMQGLHLAVGLPIARLLNKPIIVKIAGSGEVGRMSKSLIGRQELRWLDRWAGKVLVLNEGMRAEAIEGGISADRLQLMPNPVDTDQFSPVSDPEQLQFRRQFGVPETAPIVMYSGRLAPEKSLPTLLDAFALVAKVIPDALLILVGDGSVRASLAEQASRLGLKENIRFTGRVNPQTVSTWLKIAAVFALVSPSEGFPCSLEEAMSTGVASVTTDIPGNRQLVQHGQQSLVTPVGDTGQIAESIILLIRDTALRHRLGRAAREHIVQNYSIPRVVKLYETLFGAVVK